MARKERSLRRGRVVQREGARVKPLPAPPFPDIQLLAFLQCPATAVENCGYGLCFFGERVIIVVLACFSTFTKALIFKRRLLSLCGQFGS